jgi:hypothetical protein
LPTTFTYDGDGRRVKKTQGGQTTVYIGNAYEKHLSTGVVATYYYASGQRVVGPAAGEHGILLNRRSPGSDQPGDRRQRR